MRLSRLSQNVTNSNSMNTIYFIANSANTASNVKLDQKGKTLGEQVTYLKSGNDRQTALQTITSTMQVMLARNIVMKVLSVLSGR